MLSLRVKSQEFEEAAKEAKWSLRFIEEVAKKTLSSIRVLKSGEIPETCDKCAKEIPPNGLEVQADYSYVHLSCLTSLACDHCGVTTSPDKFDWEIRENVITCKSCFDSMKECLHCKQVIVKTELTEDGYCRACLIACGRCRGHFPIPKTVALRNGIRYCPTCGKREFWVKRHDFNPMTILRFHGNPKNGIYFGVELELEANTMEDCVNMAEDITKTIGRYVVVKHDGSLEDQGQRGLELVTAPGDMEFHRKIWKQFFDKNYNFQSYKSSRCSTHIHMSRKGLRPMQLARMATFIYHPGNRNLISAIAGRSLSTDWAARYANISQKVSIKDVVQVYGTRSYFKNQFQTEDDQILNGLELPAVQRTVTVRPTKLQRYSALNLVNPDTVELRIFAGTSQYTGMMKNLEFCQAIIDFCDIARASYKDLGMSQVFLDYLTVNRSLYPNLFKFLVGRDLIKVKKVGGLAKSV